MSRKPHLAYRWHLRQLMAAREMFSTTDLMPHLKDRGIELSPAQVYRLVVQTPERLNLKTLVALCDILECTPNDLIEPTAEQKPAQVVSADASTSAAARGLRPKRARVAKR
jgi:DNA-binding Xre family transcriptional regulator